MKILLELRPALDGHAGIPQETRLLFRGLAELAGTQVDGLIQSSNRLLAKGLPATGASARWLADHRVNRMSRVVVSVQGGGVQGRLVRASTLLRLGAATGAAVIGAALGRAQSLTRFEGARFEDFVWRSMFAKTLPADDFEVITHAHFRIARIPWSAAHAAALLTRRLGAAIYPRLDTAGYDLMIAETPYPGRVSGKTRLVVRYHDAIPLLMPHTISERVRHQANHYESLRRNVHDGAWFACVSEASRQDLISVFPDVADRAVTIPNMVSHHYFEERSTPERIPDILRTFHHATLGAGTGASARPEAPSSLEYLLMVSTLEPRKNHLGLLAAWEKLRATTHPNLQLVLVGVLGWEHEAIVQKLKAWVNRGLVHVLDDVRASDLRLMYKHARATVCPSFGEGFGFSGVESMRCGGVVVASDLAVHREIYGEAAEYFNPYSVDDMAAALVRILDDRTGDRRRELEDRGRQVSSRYLQANVLPQWQSFFDMLPRDA